MASPVADSFSSTTTPEYLAFQANYQPLIDTIKSQPDDFCDALIAEGYIPSNVGDYTQAQIVGVTSADKARKVVNTVADQIKHNPGVFHDFTDLPINQTEFMIPVIQKVKESYQVELMKQTSKDIHFNPAYTKSEGHQMPTGRKDK